MYRKLSIIAILFVTLVGISSCGGDDDEPSDVTTNSSLTINDTKVEKFLYTLCEVSPLPKELALEAHFNYAGEVISFDMAIPTITSIDKIEKDMDITNDITIYKFYSMSGAISAYKNYEILGGSAEVKSVTSKAVVVKFSNFQFLREIGNNQDIFNVNGTISYTING